MPAQLSTEKVDDVPSLAGNFFSLGPDAVLSAVEEIGHRTTGLCYPLNSLENRVYEVELEDGERMVGKFYRPGRWSRETILDEHRLLLALQADEIPVCAPQAFDDGSTLHSTADGIFFTLFPRTGGRSPEELNSDDYEQLGRYLARIHNVSSALGLVHRPEISPATYGAGCLKSILEHADIPEGLRLRYEDAVSTLVGIAELRFRDVETFAIHGDCHKGNVLRGSQGWFFLDFDDMGIGPAAQDLWLLLPGRRADCDDEIDALLRGYTQFRAFDRSSLRLIEALRGLRYVRYAAWIANRWRDPAFTRAFPYWGSENYWNEQIADLHEQIRILRDEDDF